MTTMVFLCVADASVGRLNSEADQPYEIQNLPSLLGERNGRHRLAHFALKSRHSYGF
jgi:hypothetical protein